VLQGRDRSKNAFKLGVLNVEAFLKSRAEPADIEIIPPRGHNVAAVNSSRVFVRIGVLLDTTSVPHPAMDLAVKVVCNQRVTTFEGDFEGEGG
jgi:hypothetical protein